MAGMPKFPSWIGLLAMSVIHNPSCWDMFTGRLGSKIKALNLLPKLKGPSHLPFLPPHLRPLFGRFNCDVAALALARGALSLYVG